jgi:hypothetical protein
MDDSLPVGVGDRLEQLRRRFHGAGVVEATFPKRLPKRPAAHVLVDHVDVLVVPGEGERPQTAGVP